MKAISLDTTFMGKHASVLKSRKRGEEANRLYIQGQPVITPSYFILRSRLSS
jgi:hypothetical protein